MTKVNPRVHSHNHAFGSPSLSYSSLSCSSRSSRRLHPLMITRLSHRERKIRAFGLTRIRSFKAILVLRIAQTLDSLTSAWSSLTVTITSRVMKPLIEFSRNWTHPTLPIMTIMLLKGLFMPAMKKSRISWKAWTSRNEDFALWSDGILSTWRKKALTSISDGIQIKAHRRCSTKLPSNNWHSMSVWCPSISHLASYK